MKIACWSGPRNISTALMRSWSSRNDTYVSDEPFYAYYLKETGLNHPMATEIINSYPNSLKDVIKSINTSIPESKSVWYQKHMAHHLLQTDDIDWINDFKNCFLIRHPKKVIKSYIAKNQLNHARDLGYAQQWKLIENLLSNKKDIFVVKSSSILRNPRLNLEKWCTWLNIDFNEKMLFWEKGYHANDGIWAKHWYDSVISSNTFVNIKKPKKNEFNLDKKYMAIYEESLHFYNLMLKLATK